MIELYLGIGEGDVECLTFNNNKDLIDYIKEILNYNFDCVWLASTGGERG